MLSTPFTYVTYKAHPLSLQRPAQAPTCHHLLEAFPCYKVALLESLWHILRLVLEGVSG